MLAMVILLSACGNQLEDSTMPTAPAQEVIAQKEYTEPATPDTDNSVSEDEQFPAKDVMIQTEPPVTDATSPVTGMLTYESYEAMNEAQQIEFMETFESVEAFFEWYNTAKTEYEDQNTAIEVGEGGIIDLDKIGNGEE